MSDRLPSLKARDVEKVLRQMGFFLCDKKGRTYFLNTKMEEQRLCQGMEERKSGEACSAKFLEKYK